MNTFTRLIALLVFVLAVLGAGSVLGRSWLQRQAETIRAETMATKRSQFEQTLRLAKLPPPPWDSATEAAVLAASGAERIAVSPPGATQTTSSPFAWSFELLYPANSDKAVPLTVTFPQPRLVRLLSAYQRGATLLILLSLSLGALLGAALTLGAKRTLHGNEPEAKSRDHDMSSLAGLAKVSVEQGVQLERERNERLRIQEDLNLQQSLLNRSLEEKIRLGHDLHDGIIQSLYATGLTLEAARRSTESNPAAAAQQVDTALEMLNRTIRDVRSYILGLAPENLRSQSFSEAVRSIAETVGAGSGVEFVFDVDSDSAARLNEAQYADLVQVVREAVSNAIRHGNAKRIEVTLKGTGNELCLAVRDNGRGFSIENASRGHGLNNIQSRAQRLGAQLQFSSTPGTGTRIVVTFRTP